jgi:hypothetical protein
MNPSNRTNRQCHKATDPEECLPKRSKHIDTDLVSNPAKRRLLSLARSSARQGLGADTACVSLQMTKVKCCKRSKENMH